MMPNRSSIRTPEQRTKKIMKEERTIVDLQMAIKKELFKINPKTKPEFREVSGKVKVAPPHDCWVYISDTDV